MTGDGEIGGRPAPRELCHARGQVGGRRLEPDMPLIYSLGCPIDGVA
jgi:hypothetical protein